MHFFAVVLLIFTAVRVAPALEGGSQLSSPTLSRWSECSTATPGEFSVCAEETAGSDSSGSGDPSGPSMRECKYFANGTIDVPTMTIITAWIPVGSRPCIGDEIPKPSSSSGSWQRQIEIELRDKFTAVVSRPIAGWEPGGEVEFADPVELWVRADTEVVAGSLLGKSAEIRFRPVAARWEITDGVELYGFQKSFSFTAPGTFVARAFVSYQVDYRHASGSWVLNAAQWELGANKLTIAVIERERRTLLVG